MNILLRCANFAYLYIFSHQYHVYVVNDSSSPVIRKRKGGQAVAEFVPTRLEVVMFPRRVGGEASNRTPI